MGLERFHKTVGILVKAYLNDTLEHSNACGCAVGNLVAEGMGFKYERSSSGLYWANGEHDHWFDPFWYGVILYHRITSEADRQYKSTGYSVEELMRIEQAFESAESAENGDNATDPIWMFNGLMAVVDVLAKIDGIDLSLAEETKKLFVKAAV